MHALRIEGLTKAYGRLEVLRGLELAVAPGGAYALVGLNGAGKTTSIECALGLQRADSGHVSVLGAPPSRIHESHGRVGAAFDAPCLHPHLTVRGAIEHVRLLCGRRSRPAEEVEELLGIARWRRVAVRKLSLGNRRRLAIAIALVGRPELVVLDEPFSGLDAGGVDDVLALVDRMRRDEGVAFLLASHQLPYLERVATHVGILHAGRIARHGSTPELVKSGRRRLHVRVADSRRALDLLGRRPEVARVEETAGGALAVDLVAAGDGVSGDGVSGDGVSGDGAGAAAINRALVEAGVDVTELVEASCGLEAVFREIVAGENAR